MNGEPLMMTKRIYVVTAATGRIGGRVARGLLEDRHDVHVIGRNPERLRALADLGARVFRGDVRDASFVEESFQGADVAFLLVPGNRTTRDFRRYFGDVGTNYVNALRNTSVHSAIFISTIGAHDDRYRGLILVHADVERSLEEVLDLNMLHLRAAAFFENLFYWLPLTRARGALVSPISPDATLDLASTSDVAAVALRFLQELEFRGKRAVELRGREPLTMREIAKRVSKQLGQSFPVEHTTRDEDIAYLIARGMSHDFANLMNDTWDTFSRYGQLRAEPAPDSVKGRTSIDEFIREQFAPAVVTPEQVAASHAG
jgi:uncharacterized protein YbjT (DUF2867 family)